MLEEDIGEAAVGKLYLAGVAGVAQRPAVMLGPDITQVPVRQGMGLCQVFFDFVFGPVSMGLDGTEVGANEHFLLWGGGT